MPIQPRSVPPNCRFEVYDINDGLPFPDKTFDVVHMRFVHSGVSLVSLMVIVDDVEFRAIRR